MFPPPVTPLPIYDLGSFASNGAEYAIARGATYGEIGIIAALAAVVAMLFILTLVIIFKQSANNNGGIG